MKKKIINFLIIIHFIALTAFIAFIIWLIQAITINAHYYRCKDALNNAIYCSVWMYSEFWKGTMPPDLETLIASGDARISFYCCPKWDYKTLGYLYVYWPDGFWKTPAHYPLMYDKRLFNHKSKGIHILRVTGDVSRKGEVFFDKNAEWLQKFALEHPQYDIPMPEDLLNKTDIESKIAKIRKEKNIIIKNKPSVGVQEIPDAQNGNKIDKKE